jgi:hypothetical protein
VLIVLSFEGDRVLLLEPTEVPVKLGFARKRSVRDFHVFAVLLLVRAHGRNRRVEVGD